MDKDYKDITLESYEKNSEEFAEKFKRLTDTERRYEFSRFLELINGTKILDLGSGSGDNALYFVKKGYDVDCLDISENLLEFCKKKGLPTIKADIENLNLEKSKYDGIWSVASLLHIPKTKIRNVLNDISEILKEEGVLHICLKKGEGERYVEDNTNNSKRYFVFWKSEEFLKYVPENLKLIEKDEVTANGRTFILFFFRKS